MHLKGFEDDKAFKAPKNDCMALGVSMEQSKWNMGPNIVAIFIQIFHCKMNTIQVNWS